MLLLLRRALTGRRALRAAQVYIAGGEYYNAAAGTWQVDSTVYCLDLSLSSYLKWRTLTQGAGNLLNTTTQVGAGPSRLGPAQRIAQIGACPGASSGRGLPLFKTALLPHSSSRPARCADRRRVHVHGVHA